MSIGTFLSNVRKLRSRLSHVGKYLAGKVFRLSLNTFLPGFYKNYNHVNPETGIV